ncbi:hypothetical protein UFOVP1491_98 [uncultured Caudovirales phage]|uniref:Uncharacterized protein n=1 Tax=uncultured Caudovirales phage TaxID=2100421 RepID=A0A6J5MG79_9CAUD|nr:hypothetical protein UFOVP485_23 [uncultured Caudovirales phage]CAB4151067.1 hypothetical protein UFOVP575_127 [uncultured Caudovirales phage]CAB4174226.1 hypothetical protein UFOVP963_33 [uncultured Caudovirales phage]CAB4179788.1 hypothetical protein UFOVP1032_98 [uncultured Caudovirales phage]CAB4185294.1 hypothetical protein UFOVP1125_14 [uncultured Caudovirales phage]
MNSNIINTKSNNDYKNSPDPAIYRLISQAVGDILKGQQETVSNLQSQITSLSNQQMSLSAPTGANSSISVINTLDAPKLVLTTDNQLPSNLSVSIQSGSISISPDGNLVASVNIEIDDIIDIVDYEVKYVAVD